ncbi:major capsid protein E [Nicoletella semolina]|uniref:Major capsid protein E n=1 Tax=Nicoletella semolina TaxID=271160 RepID=A0A4R2N8M0_9PAST|nr:inorganic pyrophosphatase [Nicoletella semolina]MDH2924541.1 inorganic pyrophosphatase [Nicoletella semolina]TCP17330.1 major capsid protein E [Nicoletella semolina]
MTDQAKLSKLRVQDPVLTNLAQGYDNNQLVGLALMPVAEIEKEAGKVPKFGRLAFRLQTTARALRAGSNVLTPEDITSIDVTLEEHDIAYPIDYREDAEANFPLRQYATMTTQDVIALGREKAIADLALNEANYETTNKITLSGTSKFNDYDNSDPFAVIEAGKNAVKRSIGHDVNVCIISGDVWAALKAHPAVIEKIKYSQKAIITPQLFAELIDVKTVKIGQATYEDQGVLKDIWSKAIILAYVPETAAGDTPKHSIYKPSFGYTVRRKKGLFVDSYLDVGGKVEYIRTTDISRPHLLGASAGYLIKEAV